MADPDIDKELRFHLDEQTAAYVGHGMAKAAAERQARIDLGGLAQVKEECRELRRDHLQDQHVERALEEIGFRGAHCSWCLTRFDA